MLIALNRDLGKVDFLAVNTVISSQTLTKWFDFRELSISSVPFFLNRCSNSLQRLEVIPVAET